MGFMYWLRAALMTLAFLGTLFIIREVNQPAGARRLQEIFSVPPVASNSKIVAVNLCPTRVTKLELEDGTLIRQDGMTWKRVDPRTNAEVRLDQVAVEKWFGKHCALEAPRVDASADVKTVLKVEFVSGEPQTLIRSAGGEFEWMHDAFASPELTEALAELRRLPEADPRVR